MSIDDQAYTIQNNIIQDLNEGILTFGFHGKIGIVNPAAEAILGIPRQDLLGKKHSEALFRYKENDSFNQAILDAVYDTESKHENIVPFFDGEKTKQLHVMASFMHENGEKSGVIVVITDMTEFVEQEVSHIEEISELIESMVKTLTVAIDERSHYTGRHTQNMVSMGKAFLSWLKETNNPWKMDRDRSRALLMSIWLHDVGKIAIPLEIMDKATRLGSKLRHIETRFSHIALLDRIAALEGRMPQAERERRAEERARMLDYIRRINTKGVLTEGELDEIRRFGAITYTEEDGSTVPLFTPGELEALSICRGTLTQEERRTMQSHAALTQKILDQVSFPENYRQIPKWASSHHELLNGRGHPSGMDGSTIPREVQLITILDIFEALTAKDRPYKPPIPLEKAWEILDDMTRDDCLSGELLKLFRESGAWRTIIPDSAE